jgi:transcriptional regulator with XRE-family HTH domain
MTGSDDVRVPTQHPAELGRFLRSRRARLAPADVGLAPGSRRRVDGLRREEVAELAGIGATWYAWLEQGRDVRASAAALERLALALRLSPDERLHLFALAGREPGPQGATATPPVLPSWRQLLDALDPYPALIRDDRWDVLAWNRAELLATDWGAYDPADRNVIRDHLTDPAKRAHTPGWEETGRQMLALLRMEAGPRLGEPRFAGLVDRLERESPEFRAWWAEQRVLQLHEGQPHVFWYRR